MSLEELRAEANAEETPEAEEPEREEQPEAEETQEAEGEQPEQEETGEGEESDDFELELDGEPEPDRQKPDPEQALIHKLTKTRKRAQSAESEVDQLKEQVKKLTEAMQGGQQPAQPQASQQSAAEPKFPDLYDSGIDGDRNKYDQAVKQYFNSLRSYEQRHNQAEEQQQKHRQRIKEQTEALAKRAAKFSKDHKVSVDRVSNALEKATDEVDETTGIEGSLAYLLDSVGEGSERVAYHLGTNSGAMSQVKGMLQEDPSGLKAIAHMTRMAEKLRPKHSQKLSKAPEPDQPIEGDSSKGSASARKVQDEWEKADTPNKMLKARQKARELGVKLDT